MGIPPSGRAKALRWGSALSGVSGLSGSGGQGVTRAGKAAPLPMANSFRHHRCCACALDPRPAAVAPDRTSAAGYGEHCVDSPVPLPLLSGSVPASCGLCAMSPESVYLNQLEAGTY